MLFDSIYIKYPEEVNRKMGASGEERSRVAGSGYTASSWGKKVFGDDTEMDAQCCEYPKRS
jgi:hypothetical protein